MNADDDAALTAYTAQFRGDTVEETIDPDDYIGKAFRLTWTGWRKTGLKPWHIVKVFYVSDDGFASFEVYQTGQADIVHVKHLVPFRRPAEG